MTDLAKAQSDQRWNLDFEIVYGRCLTAREARLYGRLDGAVKFVELAGGSAALTGLWAGMPWLATAALVAVAIVPLVGHLADFRGKAIRASIDHVEYVKLKAASAGLDVDALRGRVLQRQSDSAPDGIKALQPVAYNDALEAVGGDVAHAYPLTRWQRFVAVLS